MRRYSVVVFAIFASLLVVTATSVAAVPAEKLVVGGDHTTEQDFTAGTIDGGTVQGTGDSASVHFESGKVLANEDFSTFDSAAWTLYSQAIHDSTNGRVQLVDNTGSVEGQLERDAGTPSKGFNITYQFTAGNDGSGFHRFVFYADSVDPTGVGDASTMSNGYTFSYNLADDSIGLSRLQSGTSTSLAQDTSFVTGDATIKLEVAPSENRIAVYIDGAKALEATGVTIDQTYAKMGWSGSHFSDSGTKIVDDVSIEELRQPGSYLSSALAVTGPEEFRIDINQLNNASVNVTWQGSSDGGSTWDTNQGTTTYTTSGVKTETVTGYGSSYDRFRVRVEVEPTGPNSLVELASDSVWFTDQAPLVDNASASPSGGETATKSPIQLSINISDREFAKAQGEQVTVTFYDASDDSVIGTDTLNSNGTASTGWDSPNGGTNNWYVIAQDSYGLQTTSSTFSFTAPEKLRIYNESAPTKLVNNATVEIRFYFDNGGSEIVERNTTDGTISMTGLPVDEPFIVVADADGFVPRRIYVQSLFDTQRVYLLPDSENYVEIGFELQDTTGRFPTENSVLIVERGLNGTFQTVQGDFFGATGRWNAQLAYNERHRLTLLNTETGEREPLGAFTPTVSGTHVVRVTNDGAILTEDTDATARVEPTVRSIEATENATVAIQLLEGNESISSWSVDLTAESENGTETVFSSSGSGNASLQPSFDLRGHGGGRLAVNVTWTTASGTTDTKIVTFSVREQFTNDYSLLSTLGSVPTLLPSTTADTVTSIFALIVTFLITATVASQLPVSTEVVGFVAVACLAAFSVIAWVSYDIVFVGGVTWICFASLRRGL